MKNKNRSRQKLLRFKLELRAYNYGYYIERIADLEKAVARRPRTLQIEMIGVEEIPADFSLLIRTVLLARSPKTRVVAIARSSLQGGSVLVWLLGDQRIIREDARVFFRRTVLTDEDVVEPNEALKKEDAKFRDADCDFDPEEGDYARVLELINEFLPVKELAGRLVGVSVLRQFGLIENERVDSFLSTAFGKVQPAPLVR